MREQVTLQVISVVSPSKIEVTFFSDGFLVKCTRKKNCITL